ncbi:uncharacterized protein LOC115895521 isoform X1 [Rhinopithecus roxellana]|uniref:uncharacterized protein LOC115895521 isoform X1 n=1 Tax=Rhinopithecus roxellana TaxID=61622 RepID=UPI0012375173|nr:uncharacterized protein LOC115895521 isoform X1 [Rhinopithecus roxellana]
MVSRDGETSSLSVVSSACNLQGCLRGYPWTLDTPRGPALPAAPQTRQEGALAPALLGQSAGSPPPATSGEGPRRGSVGVPGRSESRPRALRRPGPARRPLARRSPRPTPARRRRPPARRGGGLAAAAHERSPRWHSSPRCLRDLMYSLRRGLLSRPPNDRRKIFPPCFSRSRFKPNKFSY